MINEYFDTIVIGGGPAGLTAGIYLSRAKLKTLILNEGTAGGQIILTHEIANYPGIESISGYQLANVMKNQAKSFGCTIKSNVKITAMNLTGDVKTVEINNKEVYSAPSIIISTGADEIGVASGNLLIVEYCRLYPSSGLAPSDAFRSSWYGIGAWCMGFDGDTT